MNQYILPPFLQEGDKVIIVSPSGKIDSSILKGTKKCLDSWGLKAVIAKNAGKTSASFAGTVKERLEDFQSAMDDKNTKAIFCSRGGYGAVHIIDKLNFTRFQRYPKWLVGFSDITVLHCLFQKNGYASLHAPMGRHLCIEPVENESSVYLKNTLMGKIPEYTVQTEKRNKHGKAEGILRGGNLAVYYGLRGTPYDIPADNTVLFLEDIGERPHAIERMLYNLKLGGVLEKLSGLIIGHFTEYEEDNSLGKELYDIIADITDPYDFPVCFNFPVGHLSVNFPLICGAKVKLNVTKKCVTLKFLADK